MQKTRKKNMQTNMQNTCRNMEDMQQIQMVQKESQADPVTPTQELNGLLMLVARGLIDLR